MMELADSASGSLGGPGNSPGSGRERDRDREREREREGEKEREREREKEKERRGRRKKKIRTPKHTSIASLPSTSGIPIHHKVHNHERLSSLSPLPTFYSTPSSGDRSGHRSDSSHYPTSKFLSEIHSHHRSSGEERGYYTDETFPPRDGLLKQKRFTEDFNVKRVGSNYVVESDAVPSSYLQKSLGSYVMDILFGLGAALVVTFFITFFVILIVSEKPSAPTFSTSPVTVVVVIEGLGYDYVHQPVTESSAPHLSSIFSTSLLAPVLPVYPPGPLPGAMSLFTGFRPNTHGLLGGQFDFKNQTYIAPNLPSSSLIDTRLLWEIVELRDKRSLVIMPSSFSLLETPSTDFVTQLVVESGDDAVAAVLEALDEDAPSQVSDRLSLIVLFLPQIFDAGLTFGPNDRRTVPSLMELDRTVQRLNSGLSDRSANYTSSVVLTSTTTLRECETPIDLFAEASISVETDDVYAILLSPSSFILKPKRLSTEEVLSKLSTVAGITTYADPTIPPSFAYVDAESIIVIPKDSFNLMVTTLPNTNLGCSAQDPTAESSKALVSISRPGLVPPDHPPAAPSVIDLYQVLCELMELSCPPTDAATQSTLLDLVKAKSA